MELSLLDKQLSHHSKAASRLLAVLVVFLGLFILAGWALDLENVKRVLPHLVAMNPLSAVCFAFLGMAVLIQLQGKKRLCSWVCAALVLCVGSVTGLKLSDYYLIPSGFHIDQFLFRSKLDGNVMAPNTAMAFSLCSVSLLLISSGGRKRIAVAQSLGAAVFVIALFALIGYGFGVRAFYKVALFIPMALHVALGFIALSLAILNIRTDNGFMQIFVSDSMGGFMARRLLPAVLMTPLLLGALLLAGHRGGLYEMEFGVALLVAANVVILFIMVWWTSRVVNAADIKRRMAEEGLKVLNDELERRVEERTADLRTAQHQLVQQERLRALGEMASGIAHDFNNALSPILGYSELLMARKPPHDPEKLMTNLKTIHTAAKDAANVVGRLREFFRPRTADEVFEPVDLNEIVRQIVVLTRPKWKTQGEIRGRIIDVQTELGEVPLIEGRDSELREVMINLIFNAVDAMPKGGRIIVRTKASEDYASMEVADNGTGMNEETRSRCLEPFFSTKGDEGTGLGLSMVYGIIQRHSGEVDIQSTPGEGTVFSVRLPLRPEKSKRKAEPAAADVEGKKLKILCVDDETLVRNVVADYLRHDGHEVETACDGEDGYRKFCEGDFDLVITDRAMPQMTGDMLSLKIKTLSSSKPVIMLSGTADLLSKEREPEGVDALISKPVTLNTLRQAIAKVMKRGGPCTK